MEITEKMLDGLREKITPEMSGKRLKHTLEVEKMVTRLAHLYCPDSEMKLRAAALLHDITKEYTTEAQISVCRLYEIELTESDIYTPKTLHARTAARIISENYPEFADDTVISSVRYHTTGREGMTLEEKLLYLADYIDMSRTFPDCVRLRNYFFSLDVENMTEAEKRVHLAKTLLMSYDMTVRNLLGEGAPISVDTVGARNELVIELQKSR